MIHSHTCPSHHSAVRHVASRGFPNGSTRVGVQLPSFSSRLASHLFLSSQPLTSQFQSTFPLLPLPRPNLGLTIHPTPLSALASARPNTRSPSHHNDPSSSSTSSNHVPKYLTCLRTQLPSSADFRWYLLAVPIPTRGREHTCRAPRSGNKRRRPNATLPSHPLVCPRWPVSRCVLVIVQSVGYSRGAIAEVDRSGMTETWSREERRQDVETSSSREPPALGLPSHYAARGAA